jgi:hypothetical protein
MIEENPAPVGVQRPPIQCGKHPCKGNAHRVSCYMEDALDLPDDCFFPVTINNFQVQRVRWNHRNQKWEGLLNDLVTPTKPSVEELSQEWMDSNFDDAFKDSLIARGQEARRFIKLPPGAPRTSSKIPDDLMRDDAPIVYFKQEATWTCVTDSLASLLFYMGEEDLANNIHLMGQSLNGTQTVAGKIEVLKTVDVLGKARETMRKFGPWLTPYKIEGESCIEKLLVPSPHPKALCILGSDGDTSHAIAIVESWIFDSGLSHAMPLCAKALDFACGDNCQCVGIVGGYEFRINKKG